MNKKNQTMLANTTIFKTNYLSNSDIKSLKISILKERKMEKNLLIRIKSFIFV